jgi:deoxyribonuclease V
MNIAQLHRWPITPSAAIALQRQLAPRVRLAPVSRSAHLFAGTDVAFSPDGTQAIAGVVLWDARTGTVVEQRVARARCPLPYIPGLLSFRELPGLLAALRKVKAEPQVVLCDGQGLAHPRRLGLACHLGLWLARPTVGCAKSRLCGEYLEPGAEKGDRTELRHHDERVGTVLRTRDNVKSLFVSPGHLCDHDSAVRLVLAATTRYRLPEPNRLAHQLVTLTRLV